MRVEILNEDFEGLQPRWLAMLPTYFPKKECECVGFVEYNMLEQIRKSEDVCYFSLKPSKRIFKTDVYAVGFKSKEPKINDYDVKFLVFAK